jgi:hypothetical protein
MRLIDRNVVVGVVACLALAASSFSQTPVGTAFTYQGRLTDGSVPANGIYDLEFALYDAATDGAQLVPTVTKEDVAVADGLFVVALDFGSGAFTSSARWLQIGVRPGSSTEAFTTLGSRQELTPTPNAIRAADAGTVAGLTCTENQVLKWSGTGWTCGTDVDTNSGGTVTSVATGAGLAGGPITLSGTLSVATDGITSDMIAAGAVTSSKIAAAAVGLSQIDTSQVQARLAATCPAGQYLRGVNADGSVLCEPFLSPPVITTVDDPANAVGEYTSIAIGPGGLPVISYQDVTAGALKVTLCGNTACSAGNKISTVDDSANDMAYFTSIAIGTDGLPIISYWDYSAYALKVAHCGNAACSASNTITTVDDPANRVGWFTSIAIGTDGLPIISYHDDTAYALKVAHCGNAACSASNTITTVDDPANDVGYYTSIAIGTDGLPVISYMDWSAGTLKVVHCGSAACTSGNTITTVDDPANSVGYFSSIAIGTDGLPVISYHDETVGALKVAHCGNASCTTGNTLTAVGSAGYYTSIAIGSDSLPVISYWDNSATVLKVAHCGNAACSASNTITTVDGPPNQVGDHTSIAIGTDGLPIISYQDLTTSALKVAKCGKTTCQ